MTWLQTASGRAFDLANPRPAHVDFKSDVAPALARIPRFTGHAGSYSVAQHCVVGADAIFAETRRSELAAVFLLHDAHEAFLGDIATPIAGAMAHMGDRLAPGGGDIVRRSIAALKANVDMAIYAAAGLPWPLPPHAREAVKSMDLRMLLTERNHLMRHPPMPWGLEIEAAEPIRIKGRITPWPAIDAELAWLDRLARHCPQALGLAA